jgi:hypothetical protein
MKRLRAWWDRLRGQREQEAQPPPEVEPTSPPPEVEPTSPPSDELQEPAPDELQEPAPRHVAEFEDIQERQRELLEKDDERAESGEADKDRYENI